MLLSSGAKVENLGNFRLLDPSQKEGELAMAELPDELINDILLHLPVKSLLRFRSVSKRWCSLIDTDDFIKKHLNESKATKTSRSLITDAYSIGLDSPYQLLKMALPINPNSLTTEILGSSNGLLCIIYECLNNLIIIWNPTTRKHIKLPAIDPVIASLTYKGLANSGHNLYYGFVYDSVSDDYKVVTLLQFPPEIVIDVENDFENFDYVSETNVYSLRSNSWRVIKDTPNYWMNSMQLHGALACGVIHWLVIEYQHPCYLGAFDIRKEEYTIVPIPDFSKSDILYLFVAELAGSLSLGCNYSIAGVFDLWVMNDYGVKESWIKLFSVSGLRIDLPLECVIPLAYSNNEVVLMSNSKRLLFYNLIKRTYKRVYVRCGLSCLYPPVLCLESLVSLGGKAENDEK